jgi:hypothetical protein
MLPVGPWAGLAIALVQVANHTHRLNTDPAFREEMISKSKPVPEEKEKELDELVKNMDGNFI